MADPVLGAADQEGAHPVSDEPMTANGVLMQVTHLLRNACDPDHWEDDRHLMLDIIEKFRDGSAGSGGGDGVGEARKLLTGFFKPGREASRANERLAAFEAAVRAEERGALQSAARPSAAAGPGAAATDEPMTDADRAEAEATPPGTYSVRGAAAGEPGECPKCGPKGDVLSLCAVCNEEWFTAEQSREHSRKFRAGLIPPLSAGAAATEEPMCVACGHDAGDHCRGACERPCTCKGFAAGAAAGEPDERDIEKLIGETCDRWFKLMPRFQGYDGLQLLLRVFADRVRRPSAHLPGGKFVYMNFT